MMKKVTRTANRARWFLADLLRPAPHFLACVLLLLGVAWALMFLARSSRLNIDRRELSHLRSSLALVAELVNAKKQTHAKLVALKPRILTVSEKLKGAATVDADLRRELGSLTEELSLAMNQMEHHDVQLRAAADLLDESSRRVKDRVDTGLAIARPIDWPAFLGVLGWPVVALVLVGYLLFAPSALRRIDSLFGRFRSVKLFSAEFELAAEKARADEGVQRYRAEVKSRMDAVALKLRIDKRLADTMTFHVTPFLSDELKKASFRFRATVHVPDLLFDDSLCQLVNYFTAGESTQNPRGRIKSTRFGFIGRVWRAGKSQVQGEVLEDQDHLVQNWGMTWQEARDAGRGRHSFAGYLVKDIEDAVAIIYIDSIERKAFAESDNDQRILEKIHEGAEATGLNWALRRFRYEFERETPIVRIYG